MKIKAGKITKLGTSMMSIWEDEKMGFIFMNKNKKIFSYFDEELNLIQISEEEFFKKIAPNNTKELKDFIIEIQIALELGKVDGIEEFKLWRKKMSSLVMKARKFADKHYPKEMTLGGHRYWNFHIAKMYRLLLGTTYNEKILALVYLHDIFEKTDVGYTTLEEEIGTEMTNLALEFQEGIKSREAAIVKRAEEIIDLINMKDWPEVEQERFLKNISLEGLY